LGSVTIVSFPLYLIFFTLKLFAT